MTRGVSGFTRLIGLCGVVCALVLVHSSVATAEPAAAKCTVYEIKARSGQKFIDPALKPLERKLTRGAFRQWDRFEKIAVHSKTLPHMKSVRQKLTAGSMSALLRGISQFKGKKDRLTISLQLDDKSGTRLQDTTAKLDSGDSLLIVDGGLKVPGGTYIFALSCRTK